MASVTEIFDTPKTGFIFSLPANQSLAYTVSGIFEGEIRLERSRTNGATWEKIESINAVKTGIVVNETTMPERYRFRLVVLYSGSIETILEDRSDVFIEVNDPASGGTVVEVRDDGLVINGSLTVNGPAYIENNIAEIDLANVSDEDFLEKGEQSGLANVDLSNVSDADFLTKGEQSGLANVDLSNIANADFLEKAQTSGVLPEQLYWGYQDFTAGTITTTGITLSVNQNGVDAFFDVTKLTGRAFIANANDLAKYVYTGTNQLFSSKVKVNAYVGANVTLSAVPHTSYNCRIYYEILSKQPAANYQIPIAILSPTGADNLVNSLTTDNIAEGTNNLYYTNARSIASSLTGFISTTGTVTNSDSVLNAIQKIVGNIAALVTGVSSVFGRSGAVISQNGDYTASQITNVPNGGLTSITVQTALNQTYSEISTFAQAGQINYIDVTKGNDTTGTGTKSKPFKTLAGLLATNPNFGTKQVVSIEGVGGTGGGSASLPFTTGVYFVLEDKVEIDTALTMPAGCGSLRVLGGSIVSSITNNSANSLYCLNNLKISGLITNTSSAYCEISNLNDGDYCDVTNSGSGLFSIRNAKTLRFLINSGTGTLVVANVGTVYRPIQKSNGYMFLDTIQNIAQDNVSTTKNCILVTGTDAGILGVTNVNFLNLAYSSKGKISNSNTNGNHQFLLNGLTGYDPGNLNTTGLVYNTSQGIALAGLLTNRPFASLSPGQHYIDETGKIYYSNGTSWTQVSGGTAVWGGITGTLSNQTDLSTALNAKQDLLGITPSTSNAHQVVRINPAGNGFSTANNIITYTTSGRNALLNVPLNFVIYNSDSQVFEKYNGTGWDSVGLGFTNFYAGDFLSTNFANGVLTITSSTHGLGATKDLNVKILNSLNVDVTSGVLLTLNENGNITVEIAQGLEFNGRILITKISTTPYTNTLPDASVTQAKLVSYVNDSLLPVGTVVPIVGFSAPNANFLLADGSLLLRASYPALWALLNQNKGSVTTTIANPAVLTNTNHGLYDGARIFFTTSGALPTGLAANTSYFVRRIDANTFNLSTTYANLQAGIYINTSGTQSGAHVLNFAPFGVTNSTNFRLPDLRGLALAGAGITNTVLSISARSIGANFGQESVTLTSAQSGVPSHSHPISDPGHFHSYDRKDTAKQTNIASGGTIDAENDSLGYTVTSTDTKTTGITVNNNTAADAAAAHNNMQPTLFVNYYIKVS